MKEPKVGNYYLTVEENLAYIGEFYMGLSYPYCGHVFIDGEWKQESWTRNGTVYINMDDGNDLDEGEFKEFYRKEETAMDFTQPLQTKEGSPVVIYETNAPGITPVKGVIKWNDSIWGISEWDKNGRHAPNLDEEIRSTEFDLVYQEKEPRLKQVWVVWKINSQGEDQIFTVPYEEMYPNGPRSYYDNLVTQKLVVLSEEEGI